MTRTGRQGPVLAAMILSMALLQLFLATAADARSSLPVAAAFVKKTPLSLIQQQQSTILMQLRGGDDDDSSSTVEIDMDEIESSDEEEDLDEEEEEEEAALDPKLAKSAQAASSKVKARAAKAAANASKAAVVASLSKNKPDKKKPSSGGLFSIPYIIKAVLNPFIFMQMTSAYWKSFFNYKFEETLKDSASDLRNSLQDKAKKGGGSSSTRKKRKMKPGQAKTLSDLPQLST